jgi:predicted nucleic acid-binding protein
MIAVDTSVWIDFFRGRDGVLGNHLETLLDTDQIAVPAPVRIEILGGARKSELSRLRRVMDALPLLLPSPAAWRLLEGWIERAVATGQHFGVGDLLVAAIAAENRASVWSLDGDFERMADLGWITVHRPADDPAGRR